MTDRSAVQERLCGTRLATRYRVNQITGLSGFAR